MVNPHILVMKSPFLMADEHRPSPTESPFTPMASGREAESSEKLPDGQEGDESLANPMANPIWLPYETLPNTSQKPWFSHV